jgi:hypothetical protein
MMLRKILAVVVSVLFVLAAGCDDKKSKEEPAEKPAKEKVAKKPDTPVKPTEPAKPKAPEYSAETAAKLIAEMEKCEYDFNCKAYKPLVSFGNKVSKDLAKLAADTTKSAKAREVAAKALTEIKDPATGMQMFEAAKAEKEFMLRDKLFEAAGATGSDDVFKALTAWYTNKKGKEHQMQTRSGIEMYGKKATTWALEQLPKLKKYQVELADIITDTADKDALKPIQDVLPKVKDTMARHRLASKAIELGDKAQFGVLIKGLKSKDVYDRSDAAGFLAKVVKDVPEDKKAELIKLLEAGKKKDRGGLTARGYDKCLKELKGGK